MNRHVLLFDLDGTLTDSGAGILACTKYALEKLGRPCPPDQVLSSFIGPPLRPMFSVILGLDRQLVEEAVGLFRERYTEIGIYENRLYDGIPAMLERAHGAAASMFVVTSKPTVFARRVLAHFDIAAHFDGVYGTELDGRFDNKAELIRHLSIAEDVPTERAFMIGDRAADVLAAGENGIPTIGVLWGYGSRRELDEAGAAMLCETPTELADRLVDGRR